MNFDFLNFLKSPAFVASWYLIGIILTIWTIYDVKKINVYVNPVLKIGWPVIIFFFSVIGFLLYLFSSRPPLIQDYRPDKAEERFLEYVKPVWKKVVGSVIHCVGGDGLGIVTAMVIARSCGFSFWQEFWFEYAAGFAFGWFIFQYLAMRYMGNSPLQSLLKGGRAEFFSMITVMLGMGLVMRFVTPAVVGSRPMPDTFAFWGFASLGLFVGSVVTYPMNWWLVKIGWKHGM